MIKYIDVEKLKVLLSDLKEEHKQYRGDFHEGVVFAVDEILDDIEESIDSLQQDQDRMRYCIEYINPQYPLLESGELNIRHLRVTDEHRAEMALTLMLSFGAKIYALYRGNVKEGKLDEWPAPMIVDADDWYSVDWLHDILDCGCTL